MPADLSGTIFLAVVRVKGQFTKIKKTDIFLSISSGVMFQSNWDVESLQRHTDVEQFICHLSVPGGPKSKFHSTPPYWGGRELSDRSKSQNLGRLEGHYGEYIPPPTVLSLNDYI